MTALIARPEGFTYRQLDRNYAVQENIDDVSRGLVLHVAVGGNYSLYGWFNNPAALASSHWWGGKNPGQREQYLDPFRHRAWTQGAGNRWWHSWETAGNPDEPLTNAQIETGAAIYEFGMKEFGWPLKLSEHPEEPGLGWHGMGGASWGGHYDCPGELRKAQRNDILRLTEKRISTPAGGLFDMGTIRKWNNRKGVARVGAWRTMTLTDKGALTLAIGPGNVQALAWVSADIPEGGTLQCRFYEVDFGGKPTTRVTRPSPQLELSPTSGKSYGTVPFLGYMSGGPAGRTRRLRFEVVAYGDHDIPVEVDFRVGTEE